MVLPKTGPGDLASDTWIALGVRGRGTWFDHRELPLASDAGAVLQVRSNGRWACFENGKQVAEGRVPPAHPYRVVMRVAGDRLEAEINGGALNLDPGRHRAGPHARRPGGRDQGQLRLPRRVQRGRGIAHGRDGPQFGGQPRDYLGPPPTRLGPNRRSATERRAAAMN